MFLIKAWNSLWQIDDRPTENYTKTIKYLRFFAAAVGVNIYDKNYRPNFMTVVVISIFFLYAICTVVTIKDQFAENWTILLESLCVFSSVLQGMVKFVVYIYYCKRTAEARYMIQELYKKYEVMGPKYRYALNFTCERIFQALKAALLTGFIPGVGMLSVPFVALVLDRNNRQLIVQLIVPGVDINTWNGYLITLGLQALTLTVGALGLYSGDAGVLFYLLQSVMFRGIMQAKIEDINDLLERDTKKATSAEISDAMIDIVKWLQLYSSFTENCNSMFLWIIACSVTTSGISLVLAICMILTTDWWGAYPYAICCLYCLFVHCILGTQLEICNEEFIEEIYKISWYKLTPKERKIIIMMLMQAQNPQTIKIAGVLNLSVDTGLMITRAAYSFLMMMLQFLSV